MSIPLLPLVRHEWSRVRTQGRFFVLNTLSFFLATLLVEGQGGWGIFVLFLFLHAPRMFEDDLDGGFLEQLMVLPCPLCLVVLLKIGFYCVWGSLPLVGIMALFDGSFSWIQVLGALNLTLLSGLGAAFAQQGASRGLVNALMLVPLSVPLVLLLNTQDPGVMSVQGPLMLAYFFFITPLVMLVAPWALRQEIASR